jgi:hypothetical protein
VIIFNRYRRQVAVLWVLGFGLISSLRSLHQTRTVNPNLLASQQVAPLERALQPIRDQLPITATVGYLADPTLSAGSYMGEFYAAQYSLAPRVVRMVGPTPPTLFAETSGSEISVSAVIPAVVIAYNPAGTLPPAAASQLGLTSIRQLDGQLALFCRLDVVATSACPFER